MKVLAALVLVALVGFVSAEDVVTVTSDNFDSIIADNEFVLMEFFAPWCGHCKKLAPEYEKAAGILKKDGIVLGAVDATIDKDLASKFGVRGYPTLKFFKNGEATEYKGGRTSDTIVSYLRKATGPPASTFSSAEEVEAFMDENKVVVMGYFDELEQGDEYKTFISVASADEDLPYGVTADAAAAELAGVTAPAVVLFKQFDEGKNVFEGDFKSKAISSFISENKLPNVIPFTMTAAADIFQSPIGKIAMLFTEDDLPEFSDLAKSFKGQFVFSTSDANQNRLLSFFGITKEDFPVFYIIEASQDMKKFPMEGDVTIANIEAHLEAHKAGTLKPHFKSEDIPADNDGPVTVIVGKNFQDIVMDESKDVLLEVYAPWCGHCKKLAPIYDELGEAFADNDNVVIAKMDGTANEVDGLSVRGFPTIKFFPAGTKSSNAGQDYSGGRELEDFKTFLTENGKAKPSSKPSHEEL